MMMIICLFSSKGEIKHRTTSLTNVCAEIKGEKVNCNYDQAPAEEYNNINILF